MSRDWRLVWFFWWDGLNALAFWLTPTTLRWSTLSSPAAERGDLWILRSSMTRFRFNEGFTPAHCRGGYCYSHGVCFLKVWMIAPQFWLDPKVAKDQDRKNLLPAGPYSRPGFLSGVCALFCFRYLLKAFVILRNEESSKSDKRICVRTLLIEEDSSLRSEWQRELRLNINMSKNYASFWCRIMWLVDTNFGVLVGESADSVLSVWCGIACR